MDGVALILSEGVFGEGDGKTANGLVRHTDRYQIAGVLDSRLAGRDAGEVLGGDRCEIPIFASFGDAIETLSDRPTHLIIGLAPEGGRLPDAYRSVVIEALRAGMNVDSGLHEFLSDDPELSKLAEEHGVVIRDVRRTPPRDQLHFFSGAINDVKATRIAVLGTDCCCGKRTTSTLLTQALNRSKTPTVLIGTGQTSWMQGARYGLLLDSLINDFVAGEIEHAIVTADREESPDVIIVEGQGALTHPAAPGGFEILTSARPHGVILQHAPIRETYDDYPNEPIAPPEIHIQAIKSVFGSRVIAMALNCEGIEPAKIPDKVAEFEQRYEIPCCDPLSQGPQRLVDAVRSLL
ncbi:MAG: DUF1611 domain-containing protein [Deltaproteobacteria bacterium]|nr:DUF1611 domain-containing protein [Deltaproteobacteria bacterium]